jgi:hypothetical protein
MEHLERLKRVRDLLLKLHKLLIDRERGKWEDANGPLNSSQFLNLLLENDDLAWLRKFSMLIVEIDEMFALKDGITTEMIDASLQKAVELVEMGGPDLRFNEQFRHALQEETAVSGLRSELRSALS